VIALDTNVLLRHLAEDDPAQVARVRELLAYLEQTAQRAFINDVVLCELAWVLRSHGLKRDSIAAKLDKVLSTWTFVFADPEKFSAAIADYRDGRGDFADYLIGRRNAAAGCDHTVTFDKDLAAHPAFVVL
jgi:predicted nucleic-acid-binding protein